MNQADEVLSLSYLDIQHDAITVFDDVEQGIVQKEDIWISSYLHGQDSVHDKARVEFGKVGGVSFNAGDDIQVERISKVDFLVDVPLHDIKKRPVHFPRHAENPSYRQSTDIGAPSRINTLSINPKTAQIVIGSDDGYCMILPTTVNASHNHNGVKLQGHVGDVRCVKWFPSGEVVLTASSDFSIRVFGLTGVNPRTFRGHTRTVTSLAIIDIGKQILSGSQDGTIRLWDIAKDEEIKQWPVEGSGVKGLLLVEEAATLLALGLEGQERAALAQTREGIWVQPTYGKGWMVFTQDQVESFAYEKQTGTIAMGFINGVIEVREATTLAKNPSGKKQKLRRNESAILSLAFAPKIADDQEIFLYIGTAAGLPCRLGVKSTEDSYQIETRDELAGWDAVGIACIEIGNNGVWCGGDDGSLKRYSF
ncbi:hypothetical protein L204_104682 [Cryptococcus depauperatus]